MMKNIKKIATFMLAMLILCSMFSLTAFAAGEEPATGASDSEAVAEGGGPDMDYKPGAFSAEAFGYALQGTVTGMLMIFGVLTLLTLILYGSKYVFYDIPGKKRERELAAQNAKRSESKAAKSDEAAVAVPVPEPVSENDGELAAVITAAIAAMIESGDYKDEFVGGFRVVSFKRSEKTAWNRR